MSNSGFTSEWYAAHLARLAARQAPAMDAAKRKPTGEAEADLQAAVRDMLMRRGYLLASKASMRAVLSGVPCRGFWYHLHEARKNPLLPDLTVVAWPNTRPPLLLELKTRDDWQPGQKDAVTIGLWRVAWTVEEAEREVTEWERLTGKEGGAE